MRKCSRRWPLALGLSLASVCGQVRAAVLDLRGSLAPPSVAPFFLAADNPARAQAESCLASAIYYEAANQPLNGRQAVAQVVLNRVRHPIYPRSICGVVYQGAGRPGCQFTFVCDGSLSRPPEPSAWEAARDVASQALDGFVAAAVGASTHYHTVFVHPAWDALLVPTQQLGAHQFYRFAGPQGEPSGLTASYAGVEPDVASLVAPAAAAPPRLALASQHRLSPAVVARTSQFTVWGLGVGRVTPEPGGEILITAGASS